MAFVANPLFQSEFGKDLSVRAAMLRIAEQVAVTVEVLAPEGPTGNYRDSIGAGEDAAGAYVATTDFAGHMVEWGSVNNPPYAPIRRGVRAAGLDLHELPKP